MSYPASPPQEHPSAYFVQDRDNTEEMTRLALQDEMLTVGMGGVLPELPDPSHLRRVLDVGCGTGGWVIETAKTYPGIEKVIGADVSSKILTYARTQAQKHYVDDRVQFQTMDALRALAFPSEYFDLVNQRFGSSWLRTWEWTKILVEYQRVTRTGGIIRITEPAIPESNSPALTKLCDIALETGYASGRFFIKRNDGVIHRLPLMLEQYGIEAVQTRDYGFVYQTGTPQHQAFVADMTHLFRVAVPFFHHWTRLPDDYQDIYQQAKEEMQQSEFIATWKLLTVWGRRPVNGRYLLLRGLP